MLGSTSWYVTQLRAQTQTESQQMVKRSVGCRSYIYAHVQLHLFSKIICGRCVSGLSHDEGCGKSMTGGYVFDVLVCGNQESQLKTAPAGVIKTSAKQSRSSAEPGADFTQGGREAVSRGECLFTSLYIRKALFLGFCVAIVSLMER